MDPLTHETQYVYDNLGRNVKIIDAELNETEYVYDAAGRMVTLIDPLDHETQYEYDALGRVAKITDAESGKTYYGYDALGNVLWMTDALGDAPVDGVPDADHTTFYEYDELGRVVKIIDAEGGETAYAYDALGNVLTLTDPEGNTTTWVYDALGRVISETNELDDTRYYVYDAAGRLVETTDRNGRVTRYVYDDLGRLLEENWLDGSEQTIYTISYSYDAVGNLLTASDAAASYAYVYDALYRLTSETQTRAGLSTIVFTSEYNANGRRTQLAATIGGTADFVNTYDYDDLGRLYYLSQTAGGGNAVADKYVDITYDAAGRYSEIHRYDYYNETAAVCYTFDDVGRLTELFYSRYGTPIRDFTWTYDAAGNLLWHGSDISAESVREYDYDDTNQLTAADYYSGSDESYTYDDNGNRVLVDGSISYETDTNNRLVSDGYFRYQYDAEGNLVYRYVDADSSETLNANDTDITAYTWDHRNRLTDVVHRDIFGGSVDWTAEYVYDCFNRRIGSLYDLDGDTDIDREERYVWNGKNVVFDFIDADGAGETSSLELTTRYLWGQAVDQLFAQETVDDGGVEDILWPITDNLGSVRSLVDYEGNIVATYSYDSFGNVTVRAGSLADTRYLFTCQEYDLSTGLYYYDARWYDPAIGKFISLDPAWDGSNLYRYVGNSPTNFTDPLGLSKEESKTGDKSKPDKKDKDNKTKPSVTDAAPKPEDYKSYDAWRRSYLAWRRTLSDEEQSSLGSSMVDNAISFYRQRTAESKAQAIRERIIARGAKRANEADWLEYRRWTDKSGKYSVEARVIRINDDSVLLEIRGQNGILRYKEVNRSDLSTGNQRYLDSHFVITGFGNDVDMLVARSPRLVRQIKLLKRRGWTISTSDKIQGALCNRFKKEITIARGRDRLDTVFYLAHEAGHALYPDWIASKIRHGNRSNKNAFLYGWIRAGLMDEANATVNVLLVREEILKNGGKKAEGGLMGDDLFQACAADPKTYELYLEIFYKNDWQKDRLKILKLISYIYGENEWVYLTSPGMEYIRYFYLWGYYYLDRYESESMKEAE